MSGGKEEQEISVLGRLCCVDLMVIFMGFVTTVYGIVSSNWEKALIGAVVTAGALALWQICKRWCRSSSSECMEKREE
ncbi:hypothetical protein LPW11_11670 [Geomonas sp. RF6]|uniref:hypothetical protein n=1 Tax=Geomonas sp. RF6 TaxID=2897342 RepID=UPI001E475442|nr:hypothetical protein [Geomonas sp. RF6]UFS68575.1 hypothetical protein LPW11_11670 [Geomonas sp. RF6]